MLSRTSLLQRFLASSRHHLRSTPAILASLLCVAFAAPALSQVVALTNTSPSSTTRSDGEPLSPFFKVSAGLSGSLTPLYVYTTRVKAINFVPFTSDLTNLAYDPNITASDPRGAYTNNLGVASYASFQPSVAGGTNVVQVSFQSGYPNVPLTSTSQIKFLSNVVSTGGVSDYNITNVSVSGGVLTFSITERTDHITGYGIPEQLTIEFGSGSGQDWLNSLHLFINPHPDVTNGVPGGAVTVNPSTNITQSSFTGGTAYHLTAGQYWVHGNLTFDGKEIYMDDGAILKWYTPTAAPANTGSMITVKNSTGNGVFHGWGIVDGQAQQQQASTVGCGYGDQPINLYRLTGSATQKGLLDGVIITNSCSWTLPVWSALGTSSNPVTINNIKILGYSGAGTPGTSNADGIDVVGSQYLNITNSFIRSSDDLITLKQTQPNQGYAVFTGVINVVGNTFWNEFAHAMVIGGELYTAPNPNQPSLPLAVNHATFDSNTVIHDTGKAPLLGILNNYGGLVQNVVFSNTRVFQSVGLIGVNLMPSTPAYSVSAYSMAPTTPVTGGYTSVVAFTTANQGNVGPLVVPGQAVKLSGFTSTQAVAENFNSQYATVLASPVPTATSFSATLNVPNAVTTTTNGTETAALSQVLGVPGQVGGLTFCNITQTTKQVRNPPIIGTGSTLQPFVGPIPNIQFAVGLTNATVDQYVGGKTVPTNVTGYGSTYPQAIIQMPLFSNVVVPDDVTGTPTTVLTYTPGNDYYYKASDGMAATDPTILPGYVIEQTVKQRIPYNPSPTRLWNYYTSTNTSQANGGANQIPNDMLNPNIKNPPITTCNTSSLLQTP